MDFQPLLHSFSEEGTTATGRIERGTDFAAAFAPRNPHESLRPRYDLIKDVLNKAAKAAESMPDEVRAEKLAISEYFAGTNLDAQDATGRIGLLEMALNIRPKAYRSAPAEGMNFDTLIKAFEPIDPTAGFQQRIDAIGSRLRVAAQSSDMLSPSQRATMYEATKFTMELQPDGQNILGKIMFMESALGTQPTNFRSA